MINILREFTKSWIFRGLMLLLVLSFAVFGLNDVFRASGSNNVVEAGKRFMTGAEFKEVFDNQRQQAEANGQSFNAEEFVKEGAHLNWLEQIAEQQALGAWLDSQHIKPSSKLVVDQLTKIPQFFNAATGRFDKETYTAALQRNGMKQKTFEQDVSDRLASQQFGTAALAGFKAPRIFSVAEAAFSLQKRDLSFFSVNQRSVGAPPMPTDAEVAAFYKQNLERLTIPELRQASMIRMTVEQFLPEAQVSDAEIRKTYDARLENLKTPETRTFVQVTAPDASAANAIATALKAGQAPEVAAKANKGTVQRYEKQIKGSIPDAKIAEAAFALAAGEVSAPIKGDLGTAIVRMTEIQAGSTPSFESQRPQILTDLKREAAANRLNDVSHKLADALSAGDDFNATAQKLGLRVDQIPWMNAEGHFMSQQGLTQGNDLSSMPQIVKAVYDLQAGAASDVQEAGPGQYFAIKLNTIKPAAAPPIEAIKPTLVQAWQGQKLLALIEEKALALKARLDKGEALTALAAEANSPVVTEKGIDRSGNGKVPPQIVGRAFQNKAGEAFQVEGQGVFVLGKVDAIHQADAQAANMNAALLGERVTGAVTQDVSGLARTAARTVIKTKTYPDTAIRALGVTPADAADTTKDKAKSKS